MDYREEVEKILGLSENKRFKVEQLKQLCYDCKQQMDAQDQNMMPTVRHKLSEALRIAQDKIRELSI